MDSYFDKYKLAGKIKDMDEIPEKCPKYIPTGFEVLDAELGGGFAPKNLYVVGAVSSLGKSTFLLNIAENIAASGTPVLFFSMEMIGDFIALTSISRRAFEENAKDLTSDKLFNSAAYTKYVKNSGHKKILNKAIDNYQKNTEDLYIIDDINPSAEKIRQLTTKFKKEKGGKFVVIVDYLQLIAPPSKFDLEDADETANLVNMEKRLMVDNDVNQLKRLAKDFEVPVIAISSINRMSYDKPINFTAFKESGGIEFSADVILGMQFRSIRCRSLMVKFDINREKSKNPRELEVLILKNRYGKSGDDTAVYFNYFPASGKYVEEGKPPKDPEPDANAPKTENAGPW